MVKVILGQEFLYIAVGIYVCTVALKNHLLVHGEAEHIYTQ